ncbi:MAG: hypothetical protein ACRDN0_40435, partial [Trebonia sp.]
MKEPTGHGRAVSRPLRAADGLALLGEYQGSGFSEPRYLVRRADGQVIQLSRLLYLVVRAVADDAGRSAAEVASQVSGDFGRDVTADNIDYLVAGKLAPLGVMAPGTAPGPGPDGGETARPPRTGPAPKMSLLLSLRFRGTLLRPRAASAVGNALAWLHYPPLAAVVLAGFAAFEAWLFGVHGAIGPVLAVLSDPALFLAVGGLTLASLLFHEFGHASACRYGGARPGSIGFGVYLIWPSLYTDATDAYRLGRGGRLRTDLGGVYFNAIFILAMAGCYAATGQPLFLAAAFLDNFQILQQLIPLVRMDGYFIVADLAGVPDLLGLLIPIIAGQLPWARARRSAARARALRRGPRLLVTAWTFAAVPLLTAITGYTLWNLPMMTSTATRTFAAGLSSARYGFADGHPVAGLAGAFTAAVLTVPAAGLACLAASVAARTAAAAVRQARRHPLPRRPGTAALAATGLLMTGLALGLMAVLSPQVPHRTAAARGPGPEPRQLPAANGGQAPPPTAPPASSAPQPGSPPPRPPARSVTAPASSPWLAPLLAERSDPAGGSLSRPGRSTPPASRSALRTTAPARPAPAPASAPATSPAAPGQPPSPQSAPSPETTPSPPCALQADLPLLQFALLCS